MGINDNPTYHPIQLLANCAELAETATAFLDAVAAATRDEDQAFREFGQEQVGPWYRDFDAKRKRLQDFAATHQRDLEDAGRLVAQNRSDLIDLSAVREFARLFTEADDAKRAAPTERPPTIQTLLPRLALPGRIEEFITNLLGPERMHVGLLEEATSRWRFDVAELGDHCYVAIGAGGRDLIFRHPLLAKRLAEEPAEATA